MYYITHKGWDFKEDCTELVQSVFLLSVSGFLVGQNYTGLFLLVNHQNTQLNAESKNEALNRHIFRVLGHLHSLILCG